MTTQGCKEGGTDWAGERPGGELQRGCILSCLPGGWGSAGGGVLISPTLPFPTTLDSAIYCVLRQQHQGQWANYRKKKASRSQTLASLCSIAGLGDKMCPLAGRFLLTLCRPLSLCSDFLRKPQAWAATPRPPVRRGDKRAVFLPRAPLLSCG